MVVKKIILNLDDKKNIADLIGEILKNHSELKKLNWEILTHTSFTKVLEAVARVPKLDLAIVNLMMPEINGFEVTRVLKKYYGNCKVIIQSISKISPEQISEVGADAFVHVPFDSDKLCEVVAKLLRE